MKAFRMIELFVVFAAALGITAAKNSYNRSLPMLNFVAAVNSKSYYSNPEEISMNWFDARDYCLDQGLQLASYNNQNEWNALTDAFDETRFSGFFWTSGREKQTNEEFVWDTTTKNVVVGLIGLPADFNSCLSFHAKGGYSSGAIYLCSTKLQVLCEKVN